MQMELKTGEMPSIKAAASARRYSWTEECRKT
jgi:hypothetical protein